MTQQSTPMTDFRELVNKRLMIGFPVISFIICLFISGIRMTITADIVMILILNGQRVTIIHMAFLRMMIHRCVMIQKDLLGDGCYLQHLHVSTSTVDFIVSTCMFSL